MRSFTALSESEPPAAVIAALDAWFDCMAGAVHAFGGEVLKFIGDGMLAIYPVSGDKPGDACNAALRAVTSAQAGMAHLDVARREQGLPSLSFGAALHLAKSCGAMSGRRTGWISPRSVLPSIWPAGSRAFVGRSAERF